MQQDLHEVNGLVNFSDSYCNPLLSASLLWKAEPLVARIGSFRPNVWENPPRNYAELNFFCLPEHKATA